MPTVCETTDFVYPLLANIYYPIVEQGAYGNVDKTWILDATIACAFEPAKGKAYQDVKPQDVNISQELLLVGRTRKDIRINSSAAANSITNVIITDIKDRLGNPIYVETSGPRAGMSTIFEIATNEPIVGAFGSTEYYKVVIRRSDNQAVTL